MPSTPRLHLPALVAGLALALALCACRPAPSPPPDAFTTCEAEGAAIVAKPGPGFYGIETNDRHRWAWAGGDAQLVLSRVGGSAIPMAVKLNMTLHSLAPCNVTISYGRFVLWKGPLEKSKATVEIPAFTLTGSIAELTLSSDLPATRGPNNGDARPLSFALYDLEIAPAE